MSIPTEPIGSIPRPGGLIKGIQAFKDGRISQKELNSLYDSAIRNTIELFEATGSPVITDGEQTKPSFATYPIHGLENIAPDGVTIHFADGHVRQLPRLKAGPFRYKTYADAYLEVAKKYAHVPVKQAGVVELVLPLYVEHFSAHPYNGVLLSYELLRENG